MVSIMLEPMSGSMLTILESAPLVIPDPTGQSPGTRPLSTVYTHTKGGIGGHIRQPPLDSRWKLKGGEVIGFMISGIARQTTVRNFQERTNIQWYRMPFPNGSGGAMLHSSSCGQQTLRCNDTSVPHSPETPFLVDEDGEDKVMVKFGINESQCSITENPNHHILPINKTFEDTDTCCRRSPKTYETDPIPDPRDSSQTHCPTHYIRNNQKCRLRCPKFYEIGEYTKNGQTIKTCLPTCQQATCYAGYGDHDTDTSNGPYTYITGTSCQALGSGWKNLPRFYDPYRFQWADSNQIYRETGKVCCVKGQGNHSRKTQAYQADGTYPELSTDQSNKPICGTPANHRATATPTVTNRSTSAPECGSHFSCNPGTPAQRQRSRNTGSLTITSTWICTHNNQTKPCSQEESVECFTASDCPEGGGLSECQGNTCVTIIP